jgi:prevent-host-death family protein
MSAHVGARELRQNLSEVLKRVQNGERLIVTSHNRPVAELAPLSGRTRTLAQLIAEGKATPAEKPLEFNPVKLEDADPYAATKALEYVRGED